MTTTLTSLLRLPVNEYLFDGVVDYHPIHPQGTEFFLIRDSFVRHHRHQGETNVVIWLAP